jgi:hypothetical protein
MVIRAGAAGAPGSRDALVGDLLEEIAGGRSAFWVWWQLTGWCALAAAAEARTRVRVTVPLVALAVGVLLLASLRIAPLGSVLETWIGFYLVAGTASLFAHVMARTAGSRTLEIG